MQEGVIKKESIESFLVYLSNCSLETLRYYAFFSAAVAFAAIIVAALIVFLGKNNKSRSIISGILVFICLISGIVASVLCMVCLARTAKIIF